MYVTGNTFRLTPETSYMRLSFGSLTFYETGFAEIGVSGNGTSLSFLFSGNRILAPDRRFIGTYNSGEPFDLEWNINNSDYYYSINAKVIKKNTSRTGFAIQKFFLNTTGLEIYADTKLYCPDIDYSIAFNENFMALERLTGRLSNNSDYHFRVFNTSLIFYNTDGTPLTGVATGLVPSRSAFTGAFDDASQSAFDSAVQFVVAFDTSIGVLSGAFSSNRVSGLNRVVSNVSTNDSGVLLLATFDGSGNIANTFTFAQTPSSSLLSYFATSTSLSGESKTKSLTVQLEPVYPVDGATYRSEYVTGFILTAGGEYVYPPQLNVTGYYFVTGLDWPLHTVLLSSGCSGDLPVRFSGINNSGRFGSGILRSSQVLLSGMFGEGIRNYYLPQSFEMISGGTGYLQAPRAILVTGAYAGCYDVAAAYNSQYLMYRPFSGYGLIGLQAGYLTGEVLVTTGFLTGSGFTGTGYIVTGIEVTNVGSGYTTSLSPNISFRRLAGDTLTRNASGYFMMKATGLYSFTGSWLLATGISSSDLTAMSGFTGTGFLDAFSRYLTLQVNFTGIDNTEPIVSRLTISLSGANTLVHYVTGAKTYDLSTGYLKKKNNLELTFTPDAELSFDLTQDELDEFYSSDDYIDLSNAGIDIGDLDF
jgi:hypothetical protein